MKLCKIVALVLALALMFTLFSSCKAPPEVATAPTPSADVSSAPVVEPTVADVLFSEQKLPIEFDADALRFYMYRQFFQYIAGRIYYEKLTDIRGSNDNVTAQRFEVVHVNTDGRGEQSAWSIEFPYSAAEKTLEYTRVAGWAIDGSGNLWTNLAHTTEDISDPVAPIVSQRYELVKHSPNGEVLASNELTAEWNEALVSILVFDNDGNAYVRGLFDTNPEDVFFRVQSFAADTAKPLQMYPKEPHMYNLTTTRDGEVIYTLADVNRASTGELLARLSLDGKAPVESFLSDFGRTTATRFPGNSAYDIFQFNYDSTVPVDESRTTAVYGRVISEGSDTLLIDFVESDIYVPGYYGRVAGFVQISDTEYLLGKVGDGLYKLVHDPEKAFGVKEKTTITLGVVGSYTDLDSAVTLFNSTNADYTIVIKDYLAGNGFVFDDAVVQLDLDILNSNGPDLVDVSRLSVRKYASKGVFTDINNFLDSDPEVRREDLFENIIALGEFDEKLICVTPSFIPMTVVGKQSIFDTETLTMKKLNEVLAKYPQSVAIEGISAAQWITACAGVEMNSLVNWENGTCDFNSEAFIDILNSAKRFPTDAENESRASEDFDTYTAGYIDRIASNRVLLEFSQLLYVGDARARREVFGDDGTFLGFPTSNNRGNVATTLMKLAISEQTSNKQGAWEFIKLLLSEEYSEGVFFGIPTNRNAFERMLALEATPLEQRSIAAGTLLRRKIGSRADNPIIHSINDLSDTLKKSYHLTPQECAMVREMIESIGTLANSDFMITSIITEETEAFLNSSRSAEETARIIQSRVSLYVAENS